MLVPQLLLDILEELLEDDLKTFKWYLSMNISDRCKPIPQSRLETASRTQTVSRMIESYGEELAVNVTVVILRKMNFNDAAVRLQDTYAGAVDDKRKGKPATPTTSSSAATMLAQQGSVIIAPTVTSGTSGSWNITINK